MVLPCVGVSFWLAVVVLAATSCTVSANRVERVGLPLNAGEGKLLGQSNITFLLEDLSLTDGVLFALSAFFLSQHPVRVQVWRPESLLDRKYRLLWHASISAPRRGIFTIYFRDLPDVTCPPVHQGDRVGLFAESGPMSIAYTFLSSGLPATLRHPLGSRDSRVTRGQTVTFDALRYPYRYSINAFVDKDLDGYVDGGEKDGVTCPNISTEGAATGKVPTPVSNQKYGSTGHTGPQGPPGMQGPPGIVYPIPAQTVGTGVVNGGSPCNCGQGGGSLLHNHVILAIFVWLTALTVLNLTFLTVYCCRALRQVAVPVPAPAQNDTSMWVEKIRETVREFNGNPSGVSVAPPVGYEAQLSKLSYDGALPEKH